MPQITLMITQTYDTSDFADDVADEDIDIDVVIDLAYNRFTESIDNMVKYGEVMDNIVHVADVEYF